ncbi:MAG: GvpL/GvpF family gas vesicle protein [Cyanobacteria bacterium NC_groundwater_1444_Ag_S-0.65um_54_12]|nr:GvpL/GvpF family gas vesicle protein [Cyanobacteria bacterium NC_groundwater_1444_Ag_S-0.65um_54_12]
MVDGLEARYLYCIIDAAEVVTFSTASVGRSGESVQLFPGTGMGVVMSRCLPPECTVNRDNMLNHQRVMEEAMTRFTVLPIRYGTIAEAASQQEVESLVQRQLLEGRRHELERLLVDLRGKREMSVKVFWKDLDGVLKEIGQTDPEISHLAKRLAGKSEIATRNERIRLGTLVQEKLRLRREQLSQELFGALVNTGSKSYSHALLGDRMVLNGAFLVPASEQPVFTDQLEQLSVAHPELVFRCFGPMPPCSFVNLVISWN